ncbi:MAG: thiamine diphosphokinase [Clostridiales bacterium]|nr:thiamine diphosphokinase [Clostridiales bacterium]
MKERCVVVGGARISRPERIKKLFREDDFFIYCDSGLLHEAALGRAPNLIVGDFDSHEKPDTDIETIVLPREKDDTDTVFAVKEAIRRDFEEFLLVGVTGQRVDHSLGNICILLKLESLGLKGKIADDMSLIEVVSQRPAEVEDEWAFFSLINIDGSPRDISIKDAKYELSHAEISCEYQYAISNEPVKGKTARISVGHGRLLLIKSYGESTAANTAKK